MDANYRAYLLRFQREGTQPNWRATLENAHTGETLQFSSEKKLLLYLIRTLRENNAQNEVIPQPDMQVDEQKEGL